LTPAQGNYTFAIIAFEYFTKWIQVKTITNISSMIIKKFFLQNIICHFCVLRAIIIGNAKQFNNVMFKEFCNQIGTETSFTSLYHPQTNGAVERANTLIFEAI
jgi:hypothetical protein